MVGPIVLLVVLIFLNATFASAEIAVISINDLRLKKLAEQGNRRAVKLSALIEQPARFLATIQVAITLAGLLSSAFAADNFAQPIVEAMVKAGVSVSPGLLKNLAVFFITLILAYFNLVFGELVPKRIAMKKPETLALGMSGILYTVSRIFAPLVFVLTASTNMVLRLIGIHPDEDEEKVTEDEIRMLLMEGNQQGTIKQDESEMIQNVFEFDDTAVEQICTHRIDVVSLDLEDDVEAWESVIYSSRHTYYPICGQSHDDVIGVLDTRDYFRMQDKAKEQVMKHAVDSPFFIPESMRANVLFQAMKETRRYFAVVMDEYGGLAGIVTLHDLIETLVGDIYEVEEEVKPQELKPLGEGRWCVYGHAALEDVSRVLGVALPVETYDTFNGYVCGITGRVPNDGECFTCEANGLQIEVHSVHNHIVEKTTVTMETVQP